MTANWRDSLAAFFSERAAQVESTPTLQDLCFISGRDARLWTEGDCYEDLIDHLITALRLGADSSVLEVGCASGFLALGLSPSVGTYTGIDVSDTALKVARRLSLPNATFRHADGTALPFGDDVFDAACCYDVFTNFPTMDIGAAIIKEMLRVVKPGARVLIGSIPDAVQRAAYEQRAAEVSAGLTARFGPVSPRTAREPGLLERIAARVRKPVDAGVVCYYFQREQFESLGRQLGTAVEITDIHSRNPYAGYRFNAVFTKSS